MKVGDTVYRIDYWLNHGILPAVVVSCHCGYIQVKTFDIIELIYRDQYCLSLSEAVTRYNVKKQKELKQLQKRIKSYTIVDFQLYTMRYTITRLTSSDGLEFIREMVSSSNHESL